MFSPGHGSSPNQATADTWLGNTPMSCLVWAVQVAADLALGTSPNLGSDTDSEL